MVTIRILEMLFREDRTYRLRLATVHKLVPGSDSSNHGKRRCGRIDEAASIVNQYLTNGAIGNHNSWNENVSQVTKHLRIVESSNRPPVVANAFP